MESSKAFRGGTRSPAMETVARKASMDIRSSFQLGLFG
jgi:hypothetical protein